jgi:hypothetical protein
MAPVFPHIDYEFLASLLLETVQERSPQQLLQKLVHRAGEGVWL